MKASEKQLVLGRRNVLKMMGLGSAAMLSVGFSDIRAMEPPDMRPKPKPLMNEGNGGVHVTANPPGQQLTLPA